MSDCFLVLVCRSGDAEDYYNSAVASNRPTEALASVISLAFVVYST